ARPSGSPQTAKRSPRFAGPPKRITPVGSTVHSRARQRAPVTRPRRSLAPPNPIAAGTTATRRFANSSTWTRAPPRSGRRPPVGAGGRITDRVTLPTPGPYRVVIDAYPQTSGPQPNFQLFSTVTAGGPYEPQPLPPLRTTERVDGYTFTVHGRPHLRAIRPA